MARPQEAVRQIAQAELPHDMDSGIVRDVRERYVDVVLDGTRKQIRDVILADNITTIKPGYWVVVVRIPRNNRWIAIAAIESLSTGSRDSAANLATPSNLTVTGSAFFIRVTWDGSFRDVATYELQHNSSASETGATTIKVDGCTYVYLCNPGTTRHFRVRAVGENYKRTGWTSWISTTALDGDSYMSLCITASGDISWMLFDWDNVSSVAGADMVHHHGSAAEGGVELWPDRIGVGTASIPAMDGVIGLPEAADRPPFAPNEGRIYCKDVSGRTEFYYEDDTGAEVKITSGGAVNATAGDHDHSGVGQGGQLDWDDIWSDAVHNHHSAAEGGVELWPDRLGVGTASIPAMDGVIGLPEAAARPPFAPNEGRLYCKDVGGRTEFYYEDDTGAEIQITSAGGINGDLKTNLVLDDGAGDSPELRFVGGSNDDTAQMFLDDDAASGRSDLIIKLPGNTDQCEMQIQDSGGGAILQVRANGDLIIPSGGFDVSDGSFTVSFLGAAIGAVGAYSLADAATNTVAELLSLRHIGGAVQAGFGARLLFELEDVASSIEDAAAIDAVWDDPTDGSEDSRLQFLVRVGGAALAEMCRIDGGGLVMAASKSIEMVTDVNEFSTDGTLAGNSDSAVPTEKAVKTYADARLPSGAIILWDNSDAAPTGYTRVSGADDRYLYAVAAGAGGTGGNATHSHDLTTTDWGSVTADDSICIHDTYFKTKVAGASTLSFPHPTTDSQNTDPLLYKVLVCEKD